MTRLLLATLLSILCSGPAYAEWVVVGANDDETTVIFVDPNTIRHKGDIVKWWELWDLKTMDTREGFSYLSAKKQVEYDCVEERSRTLAITYFSGHMGRGEAVENSSNGDKWSPVVPESIGQTLWNAACLKK